MASLEVNSTNVFCGKCGTMYGRRKGYFPVSYSMLYKGTGYMNVCRPCIDDLYNSYLAVSKDPKAAVRQMCRKFDIYWNESAYAYVEKKNTSRSMMTSYIARINSNAYIGKSYDDTLTEEGRLWDFPNAPVIEPVVKSEPVPSAEEAADEPEIPEEIIEFWGPGMKPADYIELEQRKSYLLSRLQKEIGIDADNIDIGTETIIKQICNLEIDINRLRAEGKPINNNVVALNTLLGSINWKPTQKKDTTDGITAATPYGVWIKRIENSRPIAEPSAEFKDVDGIIKYVTTWFFGHICKMLGIKNSYCKLYEDELAKLRVEHPEFEEDDDETLFNDVFASGGEQDD